MPQSTLDLPTLPPTRLDSPPSRPAIAAAPSPQVLSRVRRQMQALFARQPRHLRPLGAPAPSLPGLSRYGGRRGRVELLTAAPAGAASRRARGGEALEASSAGALVYAVGDVHGRYDLLRALLAQVLADSETFSARVPALILCGDYVDRGPESPLVLEALLWLRARLAWPLCLLRGNHEQCLLDFLERPAATRDWLRFGGAETLASYGVAPPVVDAPGELERARDELLSTMPASHLRLLESLDAMAVLGDYVFVHAGVAPGRPLQQQAVEDLLWIREEFLAAQRPCDGAVVVHGHTWTDDAPALLPQRIGLDTGAYRTGALTAVRIDGPRRVPLQAIDPQSDWPRKPRGPTRPQLVRNAADFTHASWAVNLGMAGAAPQRALARTIGTTPTAARPAVAAAEGVTPRKSRARR